VFQNTSLPDAERSDSLDRDAAAMIEGSPVPRSSTGKKMTSPTWKNGAKKMASRSSLAKRK
jgi:hypothetical protein